MRVIAPIKAPNDVAIEFVGLQNERQLGEEIMEVPIRHLADRDIMRLEWHELIILSY